MHAFDAFGKALKNRSAANYAGFLLPYLRPGMRVLDCGCGIGSIAVALQRAVDSGRVIGVDRDHGGLSTAIAYASENAQSGLEFVGRTPMRFRSFLAEAGFSGIEASARYLAYGTPAAVEQFWADRSSDCKDPEFADSVVALGLADKPTLEAMTAAWSKWSTDPRSFAAFAWGYAVGWK